MILELETGKYPKLEYVNEEFGGEYMRRGYLKTEFFSEKDQKGMLNLGHLACSNSERITWMPN